MKYSTKLALASILFANSSVFAAIPAEGWYAGMLGGLSFSPSTRFQFIDPLTGFTSNGSISRSLGFDVGGQVGYRVCNFRFEGELLFDYAPYQILKLGGLSIKRHVTPSIPVRLGGQTAFGAALFNAYFDFYDEENDPSFVPYLGLGIGYSHIQNRVTLTIPNSSLTPYPLLFPNLNPTGNFLSVTRKQNKSTPIGQAIIGIAYYVSDALSFGLDFRYLATQQLDGVSNRIQAQTINLLFNYAFDN